MREIPVGGPSAKRHGVALVDDEDYLLIDQHVWHIHGPRNGLVAYAATNIVVGSKKKILLMHVLITGYRLTDHRNRNGLDNRRSNLRPATQQQNTMNRVGNTGASSQYKGVSWHQGAHRWRAYLGVDGRFVHLGYFDSETNAALAYDTGARETFGEFARVNFPDEERS